jgi:hypothetical protein
VAREDDEPPRPPCRGADRRGERGRCELHVDGVREREAPLVELATARVGHRATALARRPHREEDRPARRAQTLERPRHARDRRIVEEVGAQLDGVRAVGGGERIDLGLAARRDDARPGAELDRPEAEHGILSCPDR